MQKPVYVGAGANQHVLWLAEARLRIHGRSDNHCTIPIRRVFIHNKMSIRQEVM